MTKTDLPRLGAQHLKSLERGGRLARKKYGFWRIFQKHENVESPASAIAFLRLITISEAKLRASNQHVVSYDLDFSL